MPPSDTSTGSLNRSEIACGDVSNLPPGCGSVVSNVACANGGPRAGDEERDDEGREREEALRLHASSGRGHRPGVALLHDSTTRARQARRSRWRGALRRARRCCRRSRRAATTRRGTRRARRPRATGRGSAPGATRRRGTRPRPRCRTIRGAELRARVARRRTRGAARAPRPRSARRRGSRGSSAGRAACRGRARSCPRRWRRESRA